MDVNEMTRFIRQEAKQLGFADVAFAKAEHMDEEAKRLETWLNNGHHGKMSYLEDHFDLRVDPTKLVPNARTVISFLYNYYTPEKPTDASAPKIAMYAYGRDYHKVVKKKMKLLFQKMTETIGAIEGRYFVDSAPIMEREWAKRSGLGWIGKHTLLLNKQKGSYFFLSEMIIDLELAYDAPSSDHCGTCTKCIEACPTDAIAEDGFVVDAKKCISYLTIELKEKIPTAFEGKMENWMFGCDICQDVCPWNRFSEPHQEDDFHPNEGLLDMTQGEWDELNQDAFDLLFFGTPVKRTNLEGLKRNISFLKKTSDKAR